MTSEYKIFFNNEIWEKGTAYYNAGNVKLVRSEDVRKIAEVTGTKKYKVEFSIKPIYMKCNCEKGKQGSRCKHMAAAFIAYENKKSHKQIEVSNSKKEGTPFERAQWYPFLKKVTKQKGMYYSRTRELFSSVMLYFDELEKKNLSTVSNFDELLLLLKYMEEKNFIYDTEHIILKIVSTLSDIRDSFTDSKKSALDSKLNKFVKKYQNPIFLRSILMEYYLENIDYEEVVDFLKQIKNPDEYIRLSLSNLIAVEASSEMIEQFCLTFMNTFECKDWIVNYYKINEQYEKGIKLLSSAFTNEQSNEDDKLYAQIHLVWFYGKTGRNTSRDSLFSTLISNKKVDKKELFCSMKDIMSDSEWKKSGKKMLHEWSLNKSDSTCLPLFDAVGATDLLIERLFTNGFSIDVLAKYCTTISSYDEGILYPCYKQCLINILNDHPGLFSWEFDRFKQYYPNTPSAKYALKYMIIDLQEEFSEQRNVVKFLEEFEETLYEK